MGKHKDQIWPITLVIAIAGFIISIAIWVNLVGEFRMENLADFFVLIAQIGVAAQYTGIILIIAIISGIATIPLAIMRR